MHEKSKEEDITNGINKAKDTSQAKLTDIKLIQVKSNAYIPQDTSETMPSEMQRTQIESNIITRRNEILEIIKDTEGIEITTNSTNNISKQKHQFKCQ